jgi:outer membrane protein with beta-barrel domain
MKRFIFAAAIMLLLNAASHAQFLASFGAGLVTPTGMLSDDNVMGFNLHASTGYQFNSTMAGRMDFQYNSFSIDAVRFPGAIGGRLNIVSVKADILAGNFDRLNKVNPYGVGGIGYYMSNRGDMTIDGTTYRFPASNDIGIGVGGGIMYNISSKTSLYGELQYNNIFASGNNITFIPLRAGIIIRP